MGDLQGTLSRARALHLDALPLFQLACGLASQATLDHTRLYKITNELMGVCDQEQSRIASVRELEDIRRHLVDSVIQDNITWTSLKSAFGIISEPYPTVPAAIAALDHLNTYRSELEERIARHTGANMRLDSLAEQGARLESIHRVVLNGCITKARRTLRQDLEEGEKQVDVADRMFDRFTAVIAEDGADKTTGPLGVLVEAVRERLKARLTVAEYESIEQELSTPSDLGKRRGAWLAVAKNVAALCVVGLVQPTVDSAKIHSIDAVEISDLVLRLEKLLVCCRDRKMVTQIRRSLTLTGYSSFQAVQEAVQILEQAVNTLESPVTERQASPDTAQSHKTMPVEVDATADAEGAAEVDGLIRVRTVLGESISLRCPIDLAAKEREALQSLMEHGQLSEGELQKVLGSRRVSGLLAHLQVRLLDSNFDVLEIDETGIEKLYRFHNVGDKL